MTVEKVLRGDKLVYPIIFENVEYTGIIKFDCLVVNLFTEPTFNGTFITSIPISVGSPTKAKVIIESVGEWTVFKIYSDWGELSVMEIHNSLEDEIKIAKEASVKYKLL